ncbi:hypothetical protein JRQ81_003078 [Phrynocephalus forsythii]|uniref:Uncharacterized protein n=1 Tax=Phrynocephalus forsythii TaxID=171643 RepID=A0A9Q0XJV4_9SAUR|nr:hypothetical protein JRQ81_003078 [Phrynocephalus forsythii]
MLSEQETQGPGNMQDLSPLTKWLLWFLSLHLFHYLQDAGRLAFYCRCLQNLNTRGIPYCHREMVRYLWKPQWKICKQENLYIHMHTSMTEYHRNGASGGHKHCCCY